MTKVMKPGKDDAVSVRHIPLTPQDRSEHLEKFRQQKQEQDQIKKARFEKIKSKRQKKSPGGGSPRGININVTSDS